MDNKFLDEILEIARREWRGTVERDGKYFHFRTSDIGNVTFSIAPPTIKQDEFTVFDTPAYLWLAMEIQLERKVSEHARNIVFTKTVEEKNKEAGW